VYQGNVFRLPISPLKRIGRIVQRLTNYIAECKLLKRQPRKNPIEVPYAAPKIKMSEKIA
jgi:hypothetical protein